MSSPTQSNAFNSNAPDSKAQFWAGWALSVLPSLLLLGSASMKLKGGEELAKTFEHIGWPVDVGFPLGLVELTCTLLFLIPQTAVLGAILLTGYMGGAIATHVRLGEPFHVQLALGVVVWAGLFLRDTRLRALLPLRR